jgi:hypothetical protein
MKRIFILMACLGGVLFSCQKTEDLPDEPKIELAGFDISDTGATLRLNFTDGDGNFGIEDEDQTGIYAECINRFNFVNEYYEQRNGVWTHVPMDPCSGDGVSLYYTVPWAKPTGQNQVQDGEIKVLMEFWYLPSDFDTIKYEMHIVDRDLNVSNTIVAGPYIKTP